MDHLILGLLLYKGRTLYELKERIAQGLDMMYSASIGSIQAAIKKLLAAGLITCEERVENGRCKKVYTITNAGRQAFSVWNNADLEPGVARSPELLKIYFMGLSEQEGRAERIEKYIVYLKETHAQMERILKEAENFSATTSLSPEATDVFRYQKMTAQFSADMMRFQIEWFTELLNDIKEGKL